jgi:hypothetical protein
MLCLPARAFDRQAVQRATGLDCGTPCRHGRVGPRLAGLAGWLACTAQAMHARACPDLLAIAPPCRTRRARFFQYTLKQLVEQARTYNLPGHDSLQLTTNASGAEVVVIKQALPLVVVSTAARAMPAAAFESDDCMARPPALVSRADVPLRPCCPVSVQDAAYNSFIRVRSYPRASAECAGGGLMQAAPRPLLAADAGVPVLDAVALPV